MLDSQQAEVDIANLRFYAEMFEQHQWSTVVIHWGVFKQTLSEIAERIQSTRATLNASEQRFKARTEELEAQVADVPFVNHVNGSPVYQLLQKRLDASEQTIRELRAAADKLAEALKDVDSAMTSGPMTLNEARKILRAALAEYAEMKSDKLASSEGLPTDTGASQGGRE